MLNSAIAEQNLDRGYLRSRLLFYVGRAGTRNLQLVQHGVPPLGTTRQ